MPVSVPRAVAVMTDMLTVPVRFVPDCVICTLIVPGHGRLSDEADVSDYRDMVTIVRDRVQDMVRKRATLDQVKAAKLTLDYDGIFSSPTHTGDMFVEQVYRSVTPAVAAAPAAPATPARRGR